MGFVGIHSKQQTYKDRSLRATTQRLTCMCESAGQQWVPGALNEERFPHTLQCFALELPTAWST